MKKKILIIEDEKNLATIIAQTLEDENFDIQICYDGEKGIETFYEDKFDLILLDINLPSLDGWKICEQLRKDSYVPIIMMTARNSDNDEIKGLSIGADDYITKPFNLKILTLKIQKLLNLNKSYNYVYNEFIFDSSKAHISIEGISYSLTKKEVQLLEFLINNKGIIFSRDSLINKIWGFDFDGEDRVVDTLIKRLRKKMLNYSFLVKTIRGLGYTFNENQN